MIHCGLINSVYIFQLHIFSGSLERDSKFLICPVNLCICYTELERIEILLQPLWFSLDFFISIGFN